MTPVVLVDELAALLFDKTREYRYSGSNDNEKEIGVYKYYLPNREVGDEEITPYIIIRPLQGESNLTESVVQCAIIVAIRDTDPREGYLHTTNLIEHIRQILLTTVAIGSKFVLKHPIKWVIDNEPNTPIYMGYITADFNVGHLDSFQDIPFLYE